MLTNSKIPYGVFFYLLIMVKLNIGGTMYKIISNSLIKDNNYMLEVEAPLLAKSIKPGEFIIIMVDDMSERIPMAVYEINGSNIKICYMVKGASTNELKNAKSIHSLLGPLGNESKYTFDSELYIDKKILFLVSGTGIAQVNRISKRLNELEIKNDIYSVDYSIFDEIPVVDNEKIESLISNYDSVLTVGSFDFMENVVNISKKLNKEVRVSLSPLMLDGIGLCGSCRVLIDGEIKFACIDGPEFDGTKVDFESAKKRMELFKTEEGRRYLKSVEGNTFTGGATNE